MIKYIYIVIVICATIYLLNWLRTDTNKAMEACQQIHSYDTCAWDILR